MCQLGHPTVKRVSNIPKSKALVAFKALVLMHDKFQSIRGTHRYTNKIMKSDQAPSLLDDWGNKSIGGNCRGFWVYNSPKDLQAQYPEACYAGALGGVNVHARVKVWGKVVKHQLGYRAEFIQITHVLVHRSKAEKVAHGSMIKTSETL